MTYPQAIGCARWGSVLESIGSTAFKSGGIGTVASHDSRDSQNVPMSGRCSTSTTSLIKMRDSGRPGTGAARAALFSHARDKVENVGFRPTVVPGGDGTCLIGCGHKWLR